MAERPRFYLDVHISNAVFEALKREGVDVVRGQDVLSDDADDAAHLQLASEMGRALVSRDKDFLRIGFLAEHAGVIRIRRRTSVAQTIEVLLLIERTVAPEELRNLVENW